MALTVLTMLVFLSLLAAGVILHLLNMDRMYKKVSALSRTHVSKEELYEEIYVYQGTNFSAAVISAWILLIVAFFYYYFLTPTVFPQFNYFQVGYLASFFLGFLIFGGLVALVAAALVLVAKLSVIYGYYDLSKDRKMAIMVTVPLLSISIVSSAYLGTLYPEGSSAIASAVGFLALTASAILLLLPVYQHILEER